MFAEEMTTKEKHILFLPRWYPHKFDPMFGLFIKKHAEAVARFNQVSVLYVQGISSPESFDKKQIFDLQNVLTQIYYYRNSRCKILNNIRFWYYLFIGYKSIKKAKGNPNLIHVHILTRLGLFASLFKMLYNTPFVITEHWSRYLPIPGNYKGWLRKKTGQIIVKKASAILPISKNLAEAMQKHGLHNPNYQIVPNVVEDFFFRDIQKKEKKHRTVFLHVSTFEDRSKNISGILQSIKRLSERNTDFEFWFIGEGMDFETLKEYALNLKIPIERTRFFGLKQDEELVDLFYLADYLVVFSNFENIPVVINEAQACGLAVIATDVGGISELINDENGILIEPGNENQLENTLEQLIISGSDFNAFEIQKRAKANFSYDAVGKQINSIYLNSK